MAQIRVEKETNFTHLENKLLQNSNLSLKARGLLAYMLSLPEDWNYSIAGLSSKCKEGKSSIRSAIDELISEGYVVRHLIRTEKGVISGYEYIVYEVPRSSCDFHTTVDEPSFSFPTTENPSSENPSSENRTQQNNKEQNNQKTKEPLKPPCKGGVSSGKRRRRREAKAAPDWKPERFEGFWRMYPVKKSKQAAIRAWDSLHPDDRLLAVMGHALQRQLASPEWQRKLREEGGQGIPYPATWLNGRRWEDEDQPDRAALPAPDREGGVDCGFR